ncbi:ribokinase [Clonorchis sinensis]|uniref:Ribokinase n=1 Tax=Clonorchis sinensis TaxID=79923 RepID=G7YMG5_CLOSI|nr:ribokinase [Clonorchis sinensis]
MYEFDVVVVGSVNTDLSIFVERHPNAGETVMGKSFAMGFGGKGSNQAVAARLLECKVALIAKNFIVRLDALGIDRRGVTETIEASTGTAFITVEHARGENRIIVVPGANMLLSAAEINMAQQLGLLNGRVVICQFEVCATTSLRAMELAQQNGAVTILNPAPPTVPVQGANQLEVLKKLLAVSDYCCPNETEALQLAHGYGHIVPEFDSKKGNMDPLFSTFRHCLVWLSNQGVKHPIITMGSKGTVALLETTKIPDQLPPDVSIVHTKQFQTGTSADFVILHLSAPTISDAVDTTGAGDSFVGALAYFISRHPNLGPVEHIRRAIWVASQSIRKAGTQSSYPRRNELPSSLFGTDSFTWPTT